jgi:hypothetical protein
MNEQELIMNLILSINNYDLDSTKMYVDLINKNTNIFPVDLTNTLDIHRTENYPLDNYCFDYALEHLKALNNAEEVLWKRIKNQLLIRNDKDEIENFILQELKSNITHDIPDGLYFNTLIQLTVNLHDRDKIAKIFDLI